MIIFLHGPDTFRSRQKLQKIKEKFIETRDKSGLNLAVFSSADISIGEVAAAALAAPFLSDGRFVIIENFLSKKRKDAYEETLALLERLPTTTTVLFWNGEIPAKERGPLFERLSKEKYAEEFLPLDESTLFKWVENEAKRRGLVIKKDATLFLVKNVGSDLWRMNEELNKLVAHARESRADAITKEAATELVSQTADEALFPLMDAAIARDHKRTLELLRNEFERGTPALVILSLFARQVRNAIVIKEADSRVPRPVPALKLPPFVIQKMTKVLKPFSLRDILFLHKRVVETDASIKTGHRPAEAALELLMLS